MAIRAICCGILLTGLLSANASSAQERLAVAQAEEPNDEKMAAYDPTGSKSTTASFVAASEAPGPLPRGTDPYLWYLNATWMGKPGDATAPEPDLTPDAVAFLQNVQPAGTHYATTGVSFDVDAFEQALLDRLQGETVGFSYAINQGGQLAIADARGEIRNEVDDSAGMTEHQRMNVASISKNVTAVAALQLIEANGLSVFDPIGPWLPAEWDLGYGFEADGGFITFYDLLTHRSGIKQSVLLFQQLDAGLSTLDLVTWEGLELVVDFGIAPSFYGEPEYSNINYALFRVLIPALWEAAGGMAYDALDAAEAAALYQSYVGQHVLNASGVHQAACHENFLPIEPRYYDANDPDAPGMIAGNWSLRCGSGGWVLSAVDLAAVLAHTRYDDSVLSPVMRLAMDEWKMGWQTWPSLDGHGTFLGHGGALWWPGEAGDRAELNGCVMKFPTQVEAVILVNSSIVGDPHPCEVLRDAYDDAWVQ